MPKGGITKLTPENRVKLEQAAAIDASVEEMAYYCNVTRQTIYNWLQNDEELFDKIERLRAKPILTARQRVAEGLTESFQNAMEYLKRKNKAEFGDSLSMDMSVDQKMHKKANNVLDEFLNEEEQEETKGTPSNG